MRAEAIDQPPKTPRLPVIGITMGDAAGIGPETILKAISEENFSPFCRPVIIGDERHLRATANSLGISVNLIPFEKGHPVEGRGPQVYDLKNLPAELPPSKENAISGKASGEYIEAAVRLWREGKIDAISTAPINKASLHLGGYDFPGHTEFLAELTDTKEFAMSFFAEKLRVVLLSTHISLRSAIDLIKTDSLVTLIEFTERNLSSLLARKVKIAIAGVNPHASEGGLFGTEEESEIAPAISQCRDKGIDVSGPYSPDTVFLRGFKGEFDAVIACYHDQATIAVKSLSFGSSVNVTLGLPLIRTSVDHGTAFDIAGKGIADASSMKAAIRLAAELARVNTAVANQFS